MDFIFFKTNNAKPEIVTDCTHTLSFPKLAVKAEKKQENADMSEALTNAFAQTKQVASQGKTNGTLTTAICTYTGEMLNGQADGKGTLKYTSGQSEGDSYTGMFKLNKFSGEGVYTYKPGKAQTKYEGSFVNGAMTGKGKMTYSNGDVADT